MVKNGIGRRGILLATKIKGNRNVMDI